MKKVLLASLVLSLSACGYMSKDNELIGQVKRVKNQTPLVCPDRIEADISLGVMKNGVGSMSTEDVWVRIDDKDLIAKVKAANESGAIIKASYDKKRFVWCGEQNFLTKIETIN